MDCMSYIFKNEYSKYAVDIVPLLLKCVEKCSQSSQVCLIFVLVIILSFIISINLLSLKYYSFVVGSSSN